MEGVLAKTGTDWRRLARDQSRAARRAVKTFLAAIANDEVSTLVEALAELDVTDAYTAAFRQCAKLPPAGPAVAAFMLQCWISDGDGIRLSLQDDLALVKALRVLLPRYEGPGVTLFRGDSAWNRRRRSYGLSWTSSRDVAAAHALGVWQTFRGGSVLIEAAAPAEAIICAPALLDDGYAEAEYIVDRRLLGRVIVRERYPQRPCSVGPPI